MRNRLVLGVAAGASLGLAFALRTGLRIPVFDGIAKGASPWLVTSVPALLGSVCLVLSGALVGFLASRAHREKMLTPFLFAGLSGAVLIPGVFAHAPFTAAFSGRFLDFVLVVGAIVAGWRLVESSGLPSGLVTANRVAVIGFCVYVAVGFEMWSGVGLSGDEPHYLLITESLVRDGDLRVANNYFQEDYLRFYRGKIGPHLAAGTPYSIHGIGLPLLAFPGYALAGTAGVTVTLAFMGALIWRALYQAVFLLTGSESASALAPLGFGLTSPALFLSASLYPELGAAVVLTLVSLRWLRPGTPGARLLGWGLLVGTLPFFHMKFLPLAWLLWAALAFRFRREGKSGLVALGVGMAAATLALGVFFFVTTGSFDPTASYGRQRIFLGGIPTGLLGLFFDQEFGLLLASPFYLLGVAGLAVLVRRRREYGIFVILALLAVALPGAAHPLWNGGNSPPARFVFPSLPLLALAAAAAWAWERKRGVSPWLPSLLAISLAISGFTLLLPGQPLYLNARDGTGRLWEALSSSWDLTSYLPSIVRGDARSTVVVALAISLVLVSILAAYFRKTWSHLLPAPLLLLAAAWAQDVTGVTHPRTREGRVVAGFMRALAPKIPVAPELEFLALPEYERLSAEDVLARVPLRLQTNRSDGDPRHWWSRPYGIPAGRYRVAGVDLRGWSPCNDEVCFDVAESEAAREAHFETKVALARFRLRARRLHDPPPRVYAEELYGAGVVAERSLALSSRRRLHSLDDEAYRDRRGFWVKSGARAGFALEASAPTELLLSNGGVENWVNVETPEGGERIRLDPWAAKRFLVPVDDGVATLFVESEKGFRPSDLDPDSADRRELGVLLGAPAFDLKR